MLKYSLLSVFLFISVVYSTAQFDQYFRTETCRVDFHLSGYAEHTDASVVRITREPHWGGRQNTDGRFMNRGDFRFVVTDSLTGQVLYADGFNALFYEWQTTPEASVMRKAFEQTILFPFPKQPVQVSIQRRLSLDLWEKLNEFYVNPWDKLIGYSNRPQVPVKTLQKKNPPARAIDIAILAEGYTKREMKQFYNDANQLMKHILAHEPFRKHASKMNFYAVAVPSEESGISEPHLDRWKKTALGSHYHTFYSERYLMTSNVFRVMDYASVVPADVVYILANTTQYGGGGIYNYYALTSARGRDAAAVAVHEFGHSFAGLADEYFREGWDALDQTYDVAVEPWEPNITTLKQFDRKWQSTLPAGTPVPTPLPADTTLHRSTQLQGVFEGAGYKSKGIYRPAPDCRMKINRAPGFCPVCEKAVEERILFLTGFE